MSERFSARGKLGVMAWDSKITGADGFGRIEDFSSEDLLTGIGLHCDPPRGLGVFLEHDDLDLDVSSTSLGVSWRAQEREDGRRGLLLPSCLLQRPTPRTMRR